MWSKVVFIGFAHGNWNNSREKAVEEMLGKLPSDVYSYGYLMTPYAMTVQPYGAEQDQAFMLTVGVPFFAQSGIKNGWEAK